MHVHPSPILPPRTLGPWGNVAESAGRRKRPNPAASALPHLYRSSHALAGRRDATGQLGPRHRASDDGTRPPRRGAAGQFAARRQPLFPAARFVVQPGVVDRHACRGREGAQHGLVLVLYQVAATIRRLARAALVTLAVPLTDGDELVIEAADGEGAERVRGLVLPATTLAAKVYHSNERITSSALSDEPQKGGGSAAQIPLGSGFLLPLGGHEHARGVVQVANLPGGEEFADTTMAMISGFADQAALALEIADHRREADQLMVLTDRDRIARDLHDLAVQRLFASGLTLNSVVGRVADRPEVAERVQRVVDDLDDTIKTVRTTIYALRERDRSEGRGGLRAKLLAEQALGVGLALSSLALVAARVTQRRPGPGGIRRS